MPQKTTKYNKVLNILNKACRDGRDTLFEYEVYQCLDAIGISIPKHVFVKSGEEINREILSGFGSEIMIKVVSADIAHKKKLGGVKKVNNYDEMFVSYVIEKMREEVLSNFGDDEKPKIAGFLLVEFVEFSQSLGYEFMIGAKTDNAFGPVITLSKGGDDAEFFAKYYDPANLFLPDITKKQADELSGNLKIKHKFDEIGHSEYSEFIAKAAYEISQMVNEFSPITENSEYHFKALDVNPLVITKDNKFVAVDGYAAVEKDPGRKESVTNTNNIDGFFKPKNIAVIGVTSDANKYSMAREITHLLKDLGREDLYCVNPKGGTAMVGNKEFPLYKSLEDVPCKIDLAVYAAPARYMTDFFAGMKKTIPKSVVLIPGIPSEIKYSDFEDELFKVIPEGVRVVGPNCMGIFYGTDKNGSGVNTLFIDEKRLQVKNSENCNAVLLTQSGGIAITLVDKLKNSPIFKSIVSFGNKLDVKIPDLISYFNKDDSIDVIALYVEGFDYLEGRLFYELTKEISKPVLVYKGGKTEAGAKAAASHTAAMTGDYDVLSSACRQAGAILYEDIEMFYDSIKAFSLLEHKKVAGNKAAAVINAGFEATILSDELGGLLPAATSGGTKDILNSINTHGLADTKTSIIDVTPMTDDIMYADFIKALLDDNGVDCMVIGIVPHVENIKADPETCHDKDSLASLIVNLNKQYDKPIVVSVNAGEFYREFVSIMEQVGIPVYDNIRTAVRVLDDFVSWRIDK